MSFGYVSLIENGQRAPSLDALHSLAKALKTSVAYLLEGEDAGEEIEVAETVRLAEAAWETGQARATRDLLTTLNVGELSQQHRFRVLRLLAGAYELSGDIDQAVATFEEALETARRDAGVEQVAETGMWLVGCLLEAGALMRSAEVGMEVLAEIEDGGITGTDAHLRLGSTVVWALFEMGDYMYANFRAQELMRVADELGTLRGRGSVYWNAALIRQALGDDAGGLQLAQRALDLMHEAGSDRDIPRLQLDYATMLLTGRATDPTEAWERLVIAAAGIEEYGSVLEQARCLIQQARAKLMLGDLDTAEDFAVHGLARLGGMVNLDTCDGYLVYGDIAAARGELPLAKRRYKWAGERLAMMSASKRAGRAWADLARRLEAAGDLDGAIQAYRDSADAHRIRSAAPVPPARKTSTRRRPATKHATAGRN